MRRGIILAVLVCALVAVSSSAAWTPTRDGIKDRRALVNDLRTDKCLDRYDVAYLPRDLSAYWLVRKWHTWGGRKIKTKAHVSLCSPRSLARELAAKLYGWTGYQWEALDDIAMRESGWQPCRHYPSTTNCHYGPFPYGGGSACGIPQANPCSKLIGTSRELGDVGAREQILWMLRYIAGRYGSPSAALANGSTY